MAKALDAAIRGIPVRIATARGDHAKTLNRESWAVVKSPERDAEIHRVAPRKADVAHRVVPDSAAYRKTWGWLGFLGRLE